MMRLRSLVLSLTLALAWLGAVLPAAAGTVRIEYMRLSQPARPAGDAPLQPEELFGFAEVDTTNTGSAIQSNQAPSVRDASGHTIPGVARVTAVKGSVIVAVSGAASQTNGLRIPEGQTAYVPTTVTARLSLIEDATTVAGQAVHCTDCATSTGQASELAKLDLLHGDAGDLKGFVDGLESLATAANTKLDAIETTLGSASTAALQSAGNGKLDQLHTDVVLIQGYVDGIEALITASNGKLDTLHGDLGTLQGFVDGLEGLVGSTNTKLDTLHADNAGQATAANQASANTKLDTLHADLAPIATAANQATANTKLDTLHTDTAAVGAGVGAAADSVAATDTGTASLVSLLKRVNQHATALEGYVDGVETLITATNTKLDTLHTDLGTVATNQTAVQANPGSDASKAVAVQGVTGGKAIAVSGTFWQATQPVSGTFWQSTQPVSMASVTGTAGSAIPGNLLMVGVSDGTNARPLRGDTAGQWIQGATASNATYNENPLAGGARAQTSMPTAVTDGKKVAAAATIGGRYLVEGGGVPNTQLNGSASVTNSEASFLLAQGAGVRTKLLMVTLFNQDTVAHILIVRDNTAGSILARIYCAATSSCSVPVGPYGAWAAAQNTPWTAQLGEAVTASSPILYFLAQKFQE